MDDLRVLWMRDRVYNAFGIIDPQLFEELLNRNDGKAEELILHFLNQTSDEEGASTLFFYRKVVPEEVEVEIGEPLGRLPAVPSSALFVPITPARKADPRPPATFGLPGSPQMLIAAHPVQAQSRHLGEPDKPA